MYSFRYPHVSKFFSGAALQGSLYRPWRDGGSSALFQTSTLAWVQAQGDKVSCPRRRPLLLIWWIPPPACASEPSALQRGPLHGSKGGLCLLLARHGQRLAEPLTVVVKEKRDAPLPPEQASPCSAEAGLPTLCSDGVIWWNKSDSWANSRYQNLIFVC